MASTTLPDLTGPAGKIGRYFSVLSVIPSALLVSFIVVLAGSGAWDGTPHWSAGFAALGRHGFTTIAQVALASLLLGLALQPLQYSLVQFAEGYWGTGPVATALMAAGIKRHRTSNTNLNRIAGASLNALEGVGQSPRGAGDDPVTEANLLALLRFDEANRALLSYPHHPNDIRPTRLGNVLRRYEAAAGAVYGLSLPTIAPHLTLIAPKRHLDYVDDQRTQLDLAVRLTLVSILAAVAGIMFLWRAGLWLTIAAVPYSMAYLFYRGAVVLAAEYCTAVATVLDLNRFTLYDAVHVPAPSDLKGEQVTAAALTTVLRSDLRPTERAVPLSYTTTDSAPVCDNDNSTSAGARDDDNEDGDDNEDRDDSDGSP